MALPLYLECSVCGKQQPYEPFVPAVCKHCQSQWLEAHYDFNAFKRELLRGLPGRPSNLWRYQDILPLNDPSVLDLYPAGGTPLWHSARFAPRLGAGSVFIKDERYGPTSSFKDRQAAVAVAAMNERGIREAVIASTGNAAVAYAAACARAVGDFARAAELAREFVESHGIERLNVAGPRRSHWTHAYDYAFDAIHELITLFWHEPHGTS